ncbi:MAG: ATP-binding protein [Desulfovibrionaceae bacterium]
MGADIVDKRVWIITVPNSMSELNRVSEGAERFMVAHMLSARTRFKTQMVIEELMTNCIKYSFSEQSEHVMELRLELGEDDLRLTLTDDGHEFDPRDAPNPCLDCSLCDAPVGGLGLRMVRQVARSFEYDRKDGRNRVDLRLDLDD